MDIGHCDQDLTLHCALCDWTRHCSSLEEAEFRFVDHAWEIHDQHTVLRLDPDTGEAVELTDPPNEE